MIGRGGMGVVYRATDLSLGRPVALKLIAPELAQDDRFQRRFLNESRLAASPDHASVVPIYEAGEADGQLFPTTRYVEFSEFGHNPDPLPWTTGSGVSSLPPTSRRVARSRRKRQRRPRVRPAGAPCTVP